MGENPPDRFNDMRDPQCACGDLKGELATKKLAEVVPLYQYRCNGCYWRIRDERSLDFRREFLGRTNGREARLDVAAV